jgi:hypothetical protein
VVNISQDPVTPHQELVQLRSPVGQKEVRAFGTVILTVAMMSAALLALYGLWRFWPTPVPTTGSAPQTAKFSYFGWRVTLTRDQQFFVVAAFAGATGAILHGLRSLSTYIGERYLFRSWIAYYALLPVVGSLVATLIYLVLRAGLLPGAGTSSQPDPYGIAAISGLVGLFSGQAADKLKAVFETLFTKVEARTQPIPQAGTPTKPTITGFEPGAGPVGTSVTINGSNLRSVTGVAFTGADATEYSIESESSVIVQVPAGAATGPITLHAGQDDVTSSMNFTVS